MAAGGNHEILRELTEAVRAGRPVVLATVVETVRSVPRRAGTKMLVYPGAMTSGTVGGGLLEARVVEEATAALETGGPRLVEYSLVDPDRGDPGICGGEVKVYLEPYMPPHTVYVVGCGHVGRSVIDLAHWLGYRTVAVDDRAEFVTGEALPNADVRIAGTVTEAFATEPVRADASIVVVTRNPDIDAEILPEILRTPARYIGVMGSDRRWRSTRQRLVEEGIAKHDLDRVHVPIGVELNAETLEEIAVSIMAEVIMVNRSTGDDRP